MSFIRTRLLFALTSGAVFLVSASAGATDYVGYECVTDYNSCNSGDYLPNRCTNAEGFATYMNDSGYPTDRSYEEANVYDSDTLQWNLYTEGGDKYFTDVSDNNIWYWSGHGVCNYGAYGSCTSDAQCNSGDRCDTLADKCLVYADGADVTCSPYDYYGHVSNISYYLYFGESGQTGGWAGVGESGDTNIAVFDSSCPFENTWEIERNGGHIWAGLHIELGFMAEGGDTGDISERGAAFATRLVNGEANGPAWLDTSEYDVPYGMNGNVCAIAMSCEDGEYLSGWRVGDETFPYDVDPEHAPTWCQWIAWCDF